MTKEEILAFAERNPVFALGTTEGEKPRVRMIMLAMVDEGELVFSTGRDKDVNKQITANPAIEMCFYSADEGTQVRVEGTAEETKDEGLKKSIVEKFEFLRPWVEAEGLDVLATYRVKNAKATTWTMETNFEPKQYVEL
ncbi:MAG: pyridoxamine 5'-phosphate oxidase family protein [Planctomycetota bacterium]|jgi:uncharacterized pyridoxamine 5'-phosphate oxidase family protein